MDINKYNTRVRQAISEEFVKSSKRRQEYMKQHTCCSKIGKRKRYIAL